MFALTATALPTLQGGALGVLLVLLSRLLQQAGQQQTEQGGCVPRGCRVLLEVDHSHCW
jgi:hypothetical protein